MTTERMVALVTQYLRDRAQEIGDFDLALLQCMGISFLEGYAEGKDLDLPPEEVEIIWNIVQTEIEREMYSPGSDVILQ